MSIILHHLMDLNFYLELKKSNVTQHKFECCGDEWGDSDCELYEQDGVIKYLSFEVH
jgi:hypothetical protein